MDSSHSSNFAQILLKIEALEKTGMGIDEEMTEGRENIKYYLGRERIKLITIEIKI